MAADCPCCGEPVENNRLIVNLQINMVCKNGTSARLQPQEAVMLWRLQQSPGKIVSDSELTEAVYGRRDLPESVYWVVKTTIKQIRRKIEPLNAAIVGYSKRGYMLIADIPD